MKIKIIAALIFSSAIFAAGFYLCDLQWQKRYSKLVIELESAKNSNLERVLKIERLQREKSIAIAGAMAAEQRALDAKARVIKERVIEYVEKNSNSSRVVDDNFVCVYNAAVPVPANAGTTARVDGSGTSDATLGNVLDATVNNYTSCQQAIKRLEGWQFWYKSVFEDSPQ